jgi:peptidoglycan/LPS O-acetylase OafA/YrhL
MKIKELALLTPMRGFAALIVVLHHGAVGGPILRGYLAVDFFFMLSGFVLAHVYGARFAQQAAPGAVRRFLWLRLCRVYPVHFAITLCLVPLVGTAPGFSPFDLANNLLLTQVFLPHASFNDMSWSVSAEWCAYLLFPILVSGLSRLERRAIPLLVALLVAVWCSAVAAGAFYGGWLALGRMLPEFIAGMLLYRVYAAAAGWRAKVWASDGALLASGVAVLLAAQFGASDGVIVALLAALLLAAASNAARGAIVLTAAPLRYLGEASYSIYMAQGLVLLMCQNILASSLYGVLGTDGVRAVMIGGSVAAGLLIYRCIEQPCRAALCAAPSSWGQAYRTSRLAGRFSGIAPAPSH